MIARLPVWHNNQSNTNKYYRQKQFDMWHTTYDTCPFAQCSSFNRFMNLHALLRAFNTPNSARLFASQTISNKHLDVSDTYEQKKN